MNAEAVEPLADVTEAEELARIWRAIMLAPGDRSGLEICRALLDGEAVPLGRLDPEWVARFGRRA